MLLECKTYRFAGHYVGDPLVYRSKEEAERWIRNCDPLDLFEQSAVPCERSISHLQEVI